MREKKNKVRRGEREERDRWAHADRKTGGEEKEERHGQRMVRLWVIYLVATLRAMHLPVVQMGSWCHNAKTSWQAEKKARVRCTVDSREETVCHGKRYTDARR
jgi:hypothetical protein